MTTLVAACAPVWCLCQPLLLLTCCGEAPSALAANQCPSEASHRSSQEVGWKQESRQVPVNPRCCFSAVHRPGHRTAALKTSAISDQGHTVPQHRSEEGKARSLGSHDEIQELMPPDHTHYPSLLHLLMTPSPLLLPTCSLWVTPASAYLTHLAP